MTKLKSHWRRLRGREVCPVCQRKGKKWCTISADGTLCHCMFVESNKKAKGGGWIHRLDQPLPEVHIPDKENKPKINAVDTAVRQYKHRDAPAKREALSEQLGVSVKALELLEVGIGWDWNGKEFASFPSRGKAGQIVGITRRYDNGDKKTLKGTCNGVFVAPNWWASGNTCYIVEGGSDVAAMIDAGLPAIGRPSNIGGVDIIVTYLRRHPMKKVIVLGENDEEPSRRGEIPTCPSDCQGCLRCFPGRYGMVDVAKQLAKQLRCLITTRMPPTEHKDVRSWWIQAKLEGL